MSRRYLAMLLALAALWGASFLFIKVAVRELSPATLITGRLGLAALTLALQQFADSAELIVGETERPVERLIEYSRQGVESSRLTRRVHVALKEL